MTIVKELNKRQSLDKLQAAGDAAERQMAFYLRRAFCDTPDVLVFHDLRLEEDGDAAQIDHLVLHAAGGIIIESKSVTSKVRVNERGEWARLWDKQWRGMPSPIIQAQAQAKFLRGYLQRRREDLRRKVLGLLQGGFGAFDLAVLVAVSDQGIIERADPSLAQEALKADQVTQNVETIIEDQRKATTLGAAMFRKQEDIRTSLTPEEFQRVVDLLLAAQDDAPAAVNSDAAAKDADRWGFNAAPTTPLKEPEPAPEPEPTPPTAPVNAFVTCKHCGSADLKILYGKFGYYWKCAGCDGNTAIDKTAPDGSQGRVRKQGPKYFLTYGDGLESLLFEESA